MLTSQLVSYLSPSQIIRMQQSWDPEVKHFFRKIMSTFGYGLLWLMTGVTGGLFFGLGYRSDIPIFFNILFYLVMGVTLVLLIRYLYRKWKDN